jgi:6-phosphofructokinase 1
MKTDFSIASLGPCLINSPLNTGLFTSDDERVLFYNRLDDFDAVKDEDGRLLTVELAGPRRKIFFDPARTRAALVTCGGLCPGINDVIRSVTMTLFYRYGVREILGIRYGLRGLNPAYGEIPVRLTPDYVKDITHIGGSILSTSRGPQEASVMVDYLEAQKINILFCVGGDGTMRAAEKLTAEITRRKASIAVIGIPKTIDNDLGLIEKSFGFATPSKKKWKPCGAPMWKPKAPSTASSVKNHGTIVRLHHRHAALAQGDAISC